MVVVHGNNNGGDEEDVDGNDANIVIVGDGAVNDLSNDDVMYQSAGNDDGYVVIMVLVMVIRMLVW